MSKDFASLQAFARHLQTLRPAMEHAQRGVLQTYAARMKHGAQESLGHYQSGWPELAARTKAQRLRLGFTENDPLLRSGALRDSMHYRTTVTDAVIGSLSPYAAAMENGRPAEGDHPAIPARAYLAPQAFKNSKAFAESMGRAITRALEGEAYSVGLEPDAPAEE